MAEEFETGEGMGMEEEITDDDRLWALLSYIVPIIALLALLLEEKKNRPFVRYHAIHALALGIVQFALIVVGVGVLSCLAVIPWAYGLYLGYLAYDKRQRTEVPVVTDFIRNQGWV
ncbi:MAG: hypothetical protein R3300_21950 [Candidatus Promineifilaceae bacterium]|nr:hypothetical protein [Candidatus Promineifilaceae bacterium]